MFRRILKERFSTEPRKAEPGARGRFQEDPKVSQAPDAGEILIWSDVISGLFFLAGDFVLGAYVIATIGEVLGRRKSERMGMRAFDLPAYPKAWH